MTLHIVDPKPQNTNHETKSIYKNWTCVFPGKGALSWKQASSFVGSKEEVEIEANKNCNVIAVPIQLLEHIKDIEARIVKSERVVNSIKVLMSHYNYKLRTDTSGIYCAWLSCGHDEPTRIVDGRCPNYYCDGYRNV